MDDKFRLVFAYPEETPLAEAYAGDRAIVCDDLREAVKIGSEMNVIRGVPFIAHKFTVIDPVVVDLIHKEFVIPRSS